MKFLAVLLGFLLAALSPAEARLHAGPNVLESSGHRLRAVTGALDQNPGAAAGYSFRLLRQAYLGTGASVRLRRASDNGELDIGFTAGGDFDTAAATAHCAATSCFIRTWYDQSGNGRHAQQATTANQPPLVFNCTGSLPCLQLTSATVGLSTGTVTPATGVATFNTIANRTAGTGACWLLFQNGAGANRLTYRGVPGLALWGGISGSVPNTSPDNTWRSVTGVLNGASSSINDNGSTVTATVTGNAVAGPIGNLGQAATTCLQTEAILWDNYPLTVAEVTALTNNQWNYWIGLPLDPFTTPTGAYSLRKLKSTYTGSAIRLRRTSDSTEQDIGFLGFVPGLGSPFDTAAANAFCAATSCFVRTWYDQSGNARHSQASVPAAQPALIFSCVNGQPCVQSLTGTSLQGASMTPATGAASASWVANRTTGTTSAPMVILAGVVGNRLNYNAAGAGIQASGNVGNITSAAGTNAAWHAAIGVFNGASSSLTVDGATTAGSLTNGTAAGVSGVFGAAATTVNSAEFVFWDNYLLTAGEIAALTANQRSFWGF